MNISDCENLQEDIHDMKIWADKWLLRFHPDKCKTMRVGRSKVEEHDYSLDPKWNPMIKCTEEKDIGVVIDNKLSFEKHIVEKVNKANMIVGIIRRTFEYMDKKVFRSLYTALVRPHIEYANQVWSPHLKKHIDMIENVQKRATKQIPGLKDLPYEDRLKELNLPTLAYRRIRGDLIETYKIASGKYDPEVSDILTFTENTATRGHKYKLFKKRPRLDVRKYSFCYRVTDVWNQLPCEVVEAKTVLSFEKRLDKFLKDQPIYYNYTEPIVINNSYIDDIDSEEDEELVSQA